MIGPPRRYSSSTCSRSWADKAEMGRAPATVLGTTACHRRPLGHCRLDTQDAGVPFLHLERLESLLVVSAEKFNKLAMVRRRRVPLESALTPLGFIFRSAKTIEVTSCGSLPTASVSGRATPIFGWIAPTASCGVSLFCPNASNDPAAVDFVDADAAEPFGLLFQRTLMCGGILRVGSDFFSSSTRFSHDALVDL